MYSFKQHVKYNESAFRNVYFEFDYVYSSYFAIDPSSGDLYVRRVLYPTTFTVRIEIEYDVTLKNGTVFSDDEYVYARIVAIGEITVLNFSLVILDCHCGTYVMQF